MILTVVVVTYNCKRILNHTISSIKTFSQTFRGELEIIAVDGNSNDGTVEFLREAQLFDLIVSEVDSGIFDAMNKAAKIAHGTWICYMNAGDKFGDFNGVDIASILQNMSTDYAVVYGDCEVVFDGVHTIHKKAEPNPSERKIMPFCHQSAFTRTNLVAEIGFDIQYPRVADQKLYLELYLAGWKFLYQNNVYSIVEAEGFSSENFLKTAKEELDVKFAYGLISKLQFKLMYMKSLLIWNVKRFSPSIVKMIKRKVLGV